MSKIEKYHEEMKELKAKIKKAKLGLADGFGRRVAEVRKSKGLSTRELSDLLGLSRGQVANIELGNGFPSLPGFVLICKVLDVTPNALLGFDT